MFKLLLFHNNYTVTKKWRRDTDASEDLTEILSKFVEVTEDCDAKRMRLEAELEEKRREQERRHEERMMTMMMGFMQQLVGFPHASRPLSQAHNPSTSIPRPPFPPSYPCTSNFPPSYATPPFSSNQPFPTPDLEQSPNSPYYNSDM